MDELIDRLTAHAAEFVRALDEGAKEVAGGLQLSTGERVWTSGLRAGTVESPEGPLSLVELAARRMALTPRMARQFCEDTLEQIENPEPESAPADLERANMELQVVRPKTAARTEIQRLLPQATDAEQGVLCAFLIAPEPVGALMAEMGVQESWFAVPAHAIIFEQLRWLHEQRMTVDFVVLTQMLRDQGKLDECGGPAYITSLFTYLPTPANARQHAQILEEKHALREVIRLGTEYAEKAHTDQDRVTELLNEFVEKVCAVKTGRSAQAFDAMLGERAFDVAHPPAEPPAVFILGGSVIATPENFMVVQAKVKAGKTAFLGAMIAATMDVAGGDCLGVSSENPKGRAVIHFDTEQSKYHHHMVLRRALVRAGRQTPPEWLFSYYVKGLSVEQLMQALRGALKRRHQQCGGIHAVILDGIGDYCADVNDAEASFALVAELERLAVEYQTVFVCVLHENPGSDIGKTRGHLGSHLERKAETNLRMEKDGEGVTCVWADRARTAHIPKDKGVRFAWNEEHKMHMTTDAPFVPPTKAGQKTPGVRKNDRLEAAKVALGRHFAKGATVSRSGLYTILTAKTPGGPKPIGERSFDNYWSELKAAGLIAQDTAVKRMWAATAAWATELTEDYPDEEEESQ